MKPLIGIERISKIFPVPSRALFTPPLSLRALDQVSLQIFDGEILGLVGESGCGKSTLGRIILRLIEPSSGRIDFDGTDLLRLRGSALRRFRRNMQLIFQDPYSSLNPRLTVEKIVGEPLAIHRLAKGPALRDKVVELLQEVGLSAEALDKYPHQFSGGQRQRLGIARALAVRPRFVVADEPVSALDVSIRAQILNLLVELQRRHKLTMLFISHDLNVIQYLADRIAVMYLGKVMEVLPPGTPAQAALHPYTQALLRSVPQLEAKPGTKHQPLRGEIPSPLNPPSGCVFHTRCPLVQEICRREVPTLEEKRPQHCCACHLVKKQP